MLSRVFRVQHGEYTLLIFATIDKLALIENKRECATRHAVICSPDIPVVGMPSHSHKRIWKNAAQIVLHKFRIRGFLHGFRIWVFPKQVGWHVAPTERITMT
jgi:hypothetical protein